MVAMKTTDVIVPFDISAEGQEYRVNWGMDTAWNWDYNVNRGVAHIGKGNFAYGRISFQPTAEVIDNGDGTYTLTAKQKAAMEKAGLDYTPVSTYELAYAGTRTLLNGLEDDQP